MLWFKTVEWIFQITTNRWDQLNKEIWEVHQAKESTSDLTPDLTTEHFCLETLQHEQWESSSEWALKNYNYHLDTLSSLLSYNQTFSTFILELTLIRNKGSSQIVSGTKFSHPRKGDFPCTQIWLQNSILYDNYVCTNSYPDTFMPNRACSTCSKWRENGSSDNSFAHSSGLYSNPTRSNSNIQGLSQFTSYFGFLYYYNNVMLFLNCSFNLDSLSLSYGIFRSLELWSNYG